ncbi:MAG: hypothetical protein BGO69_12935 [Bacteroidetes bacterium 46-16]|nr:MAG: hypothetical protein BGO69_12935 [Bacteroidetes bacterium 46-16]
MYACGNTVYKLGNGNTTVKNIERGKSDVDLFPNPVNSGEGIFIKTKAAFNSISVEIRDITGRRIYNEILTSRSTLYRMSGFLKKGVYFLSIKAQDDNIVVKTLEVD